MTRTTTVVECPFTIIVDSREQRPYTFVGLRTDAKQRYQVLQIEWEWGTLKSGDYSIQGHEDEIAIERKSLQDLYSSLGQGRPRFEREVQRLAQYKHAIIIVEADWNEALTRPPKHTRLQAKTVYRTTISWSLRYDVHFWFVPGRRMGEITTFRFLNRYWELQNGN